jgi:hypothetical protein
MKSFYIFISIIALSFLFVTKNNAQCTNASAFGTAAAPTGTASVTISTCTFQTEYNTITGNCCW